MSPLETNARKLIELVVQRFPLGGKDAELQRQFAKDCGLRRQSFFYALRHAREVGWLVKDQGLLYQLDPRGSWKPKSTEPGAEPALNRDQLEYLADARAQKIAELENQIAHVRDWSSGNANGIAVVHLAEILSSSTATKRQKLRAAAGIVSYKAHAGTTEFAKRFLESLTANTDIATDDRIEAAYIIDP